MPVTVRQAVIADLDRLIPLFDGYRQFYEQPSDLDCARTFLFDRFEHQESIIYIAEDENKNALGFAQIFPSFSSVAAARLYILNDLFVLPDHRGKGIAGLLLESAAEYGRTAGAARMMLTTAVNNSTAQALYESKNWRRDKTDFTYVLKFS